MRIKKLYSYLIKGYLGTFLATFVVCLFVVLMQFLWRYIDEMVGKGLEVSVLFEFFIYAAMSLLSMALPLAVLLASLITFGNLSERLELLAMKAAGISLFRIIRPYIVFISILAIAAFFYSDIAMPKIQTKLYTLIISMKQKSPEVEIPEGSFYKGIEGYHVYVKEKDKRTKLLKDVLIYDFSDGFDNSVVMAADSARLKMADNKQSLLLILSNGESFENLKKQSDSQKNVPYRRETFTHKEILIDFDSNFDKMDESIMSNRYLGKNLSELSQAIDSMQTHRDSISNSQFHIYQRHFFDRGASATDRIGLTKTKNTSEFNLDRLTKRLTTSQKLDVMEKSLRQIDRMRMDIPFIQGSNDSDDSRIRRFDIERHRKFTLSFACLIFFFIGAPLGAIIRKGGIGLPVVISIILFIIYYIIDNTGYKMAREGIWHIWIGMWFSSMVLFPLGICATYLAATDRTLPSIQLKDLKNKIIKFKNNRFKRKD